MSEPEDDPYPVDHDFCLIHGFEFMTQAFGNPIAYCAECEREITERLRDDRT